MFYMQELRSEIHRQSGKRANAEQPAKGGTPKVRRSFFNVRTNYTLTNVCPVFYILYFYYKTLKRIS